MMRVLIDGEPIAPQDASISVFDWTVLRGAGCFEAVRAYGGRPFALAAHLERLKHSAAALELALPDDERLRAWVQRVAEAGGDCVVRVLVTHGGRDAEVEAPPHVVVLREPLPEIPEVFRLLPVAAPWHPAGADWALTGVKSLSYGPNMGALREARAQGYDDAVLYGRQGQVLEAPTSAIAWVKDGALETPSLDLGILASVTRAIVVEEAPRLGVSVREGTFPLSRLEEADEVMILATTKEVSPVAAVGETALTPGEVTRALGEAFRARVAAGG